jgi:hypothetical protein
MRQTLFFCFCAMAVLACNKDKVETTPHLTFKSFNQSVIDTTDSELRITLEFTDQEGDLDSVYVVRRRSNIHDPSPQTKILDYAVPKFSGQNKGELLLILNKQNDLVVNLAEIRIPGTVPRRNEPDTLQLRFFAKDREKHTSDTTSPKQVIVIR